MVEKSSEAEKNARLEIYVKSLEDKIHVLQKEKAEYLQNVAHQIVQPLNAIKWHVENITSARVDVERGKKALRSIYSQATLAVHLAKNFNLMSNLESDISLSAVIEPLEPVTMGRLLINLSDDFQPLGWGKNVNIVVNIKSFSSMPDILAIRALISQVFANLLENAIKYSDKNTVIRVEGKYDSTSEAATITVTNRGIPIKKEEQEKIFERGYRSQLAKNAHPPGTGFGLYISKKIVELHQGAINVLTDDTHTSFNVLLYRKKLEGKAKAWGKKQSY